MLSKLIEFVKRHETNIILLFSIVLITITSFNLGKLAAYRENKIPVTIKGANDIVRLPGAGDRAIVTETNLIKDLAVVASRKSNNKLYHFSWCAGALKIAAANKISFTNETAAIAAGYTLAANCNR